MTDPTPEEIIEKQKAAQAPPPVAPGFILNAIKETSDASKSVTPPSESEDQVLIRSIDSDFWRIVKRQIDHMKQGIRDNTRMDVEKAGFSLESAGMRYILADQMCQVLSDLVNFVEGRAKIMQQMATDENEKQKEKDNAAKVDTTQNN